MDYMWLDVHLDLDKPLHYRDAESIRVKVCYLSRGGRLVSYTHEHLRRFLSNISINIYNEIKLLELLDRTTGDCDLDRWEYLSVVKEKLDAITEGSYFSGRDYACAMKPREWNILINNIKSWLRTVSYNYQV